MGKWLRRLFKLAGAAAGLALAVGICVAGVIAYRGHRLYQSALDAEPLAEKIAGIQAIEDYTPLGQLPELYRNAVIAVEDHRFYEHPGIDVIAIGRALLHDLRAGAFVEGGSTITQQLAKNLYFTQEKELTRKAAEVFMAFDLEKSYTKDEILELYLNSIYFGDGCYTVRSASLSYFGKEPADLSPDECTLLAGIPNAPSVYDLNANPDLAKQRQRQVLGRMVERGYLTEEEAQEIVEYPSAGPNGAGA